MVIDLFTEDVDFPNGNLPQVSTANGTFRSGFARCAIGTQSDFLKSTSFTPLTSGWMCAQVYLSSNNSSPQNAIIGFGKSGTNSGLFFGFNWGTAKPLLWSIANGAYTLLATSVQPINEATTHRIDFQIINYGANGTINVYVDGALNMSYTGAIAIDGAPNLDSVFIGSTRSYCMAYSSEIVIADESTLGCQGVDLREITGNGTVQQFNNPAYTNFNPTVINDANSTYSNTAGQDEQATLANSVAGNFAIKAVKIVARANAPAGSAITNLKLGFSNGAGVVGVGAAHALGVGFAPVADILTTDPTTGQPFTSIDGYQIDLRSA